MKKEVINLGNYMKFIRLFTNKVLLTSIAGLLAFSLANNAHAGKFYFTFGYGLDSNEFDFAEISLSSGGDYASTVDLGGTYYFNKYGMRLLSFDVFSALDSVQEYNFLFAGGVRVFFLGAELNEDPDQRDQSSLGLMPGIDLGYRFETAIPTVLLWSFDYAPNLLTLNHLEDLIQTNVIYEVMFTPVVICQVSYRYGTASFDEQRAGPIPKEIRKFENSIGLGLKIRF